MAIAGIHLTRIGKGNFLLEPRRSMDIQEQDTLLREIIAVLQRDQGKKLYYDLDALAVIDQVYYGWLDRLARTCSAVNVQMICINMQPTAAFSLSQFLDKQPAFATALAVPD